MNIDARHGTVSLVQGGQTNNYGSKYDSAMERLADASTKDAAFDSDARHPAPKCLPGTREDLIISIMGTLSDRNCCLEGMAGWGKSALVQSIAERFDEEGQLAASFFFSRRKPGCNEIKYLFPTIAYQLTISMPNLKPLIADAITRDPSILHKIPPRQFQKLIVNPVSKATGLPSSMVVVLDAIDECQDEESAADIISLVTDAQRNSRFPIRFLITSRPEPYLRAKIHSPKIGHITWILALQDFDSRDDIRTFLRHRFDDISAKHEVLRSIKSPWPSEPDFESLVQKASGLFIYAATVMNFLCDRNGHPVRRLETILQVEPSSSPSAYTALDQLYVQILSGTPNIDSLRDVLGVIFTLFDALPIKVLEELLSLESGDISFALTGLHSILFIPSDNDQSVATFHESLRDFLTDAERSNLYFIDLPLHHSRMAHCCLTRLNRGISESWAYLYACGYWASHLRHSPCSDGLIRDLDAIANITMLHWIHTLSYSYDLDGALKSLQCTNHWLKSHQSKQSLIITASPTPTAYIILTSNTKQIPAFKLYYVHIWGLLELLYEAEQYIMAYKSRPKLCIEDWKTFRKKREKLWRITFRRLRYAVPILNIKAIALSGETPLRKVDAAVRG